MKRIPKPVGLPRFTYALVVCALIATLGVGSSMAADKNVKVTIVYDHALPNVPGKSIKGVLVEYGPGGSSPAHIRYGRKRAVNAARKMRRLLSE
jgi:hypothetical protein